MAKFTEGHKLAKGRPAGSKNKRTLQVEEIAAKYDLDVFEVLVMVAVGDWQGLGYQSKSKISYTNAGIEFEEDYIKLSDRVQAAKEAAKYLYSQKQSVALSTGDTGIKILIEDYSKKE